MTSRILQYRVNYSQRVLQKHNTILILHYKKSFYKLINDEPLLADNMDNEGVNTKGEECRQTSFQSGWMKVFSVS